jgi:hypothetical protein
MDPPRPEPPPSRRNKLDSGPLDSVINILFPAKYVHRETTASTSAASTMTAIQDLRVHAPVIIAEAVCLIVFCSLMVGLRFYARRLKASRLGLDDLAIALGLVRFILI